MSNPPDEPVLPDVTTDERDRGWGDDAGRDEEDRRLVEDRPPHWDDRD